MRTTARIELPTGIRIDKGVPTSIDWENKKGPAVATITKVEVYGEGRHIAVDLELDIDLDIAFNGAGHQAPNKRGVIVGIKPPVLPQAPAAS